MTRVVTLIGRGGALPLSLGLGEVCAIALAPPEREGRLQAARAAGAKRAVALWEEALVDTDYYGMAQVLAAIAKRVGFDIVVCSDGDRGILGPAIADRLGIPHLSGIVSASCADGRVVVQRCAGGALRSYSAGPPILLGVVRSPDEPAAAGGDGSPVERLELSGIGVAAAELRWRRRFAPRPAPGPEARPRVFPEVGALVTRLASEGLLIPQPAPTEPTPPPKEASV